MPKVELNDIRLAVSPLTDTVHVGVIDHKDKTLSTWLHHRDVTKDFLNCVVDRLKVEEDGELELRVGGELRYTIKLIPAQGIGAAAEGGSVSDDTRAKPDPTEGRDAPNP